MEALRSTETMMRFYQNTWNHMPEESTPHKHGRGNLRAYSFRKNMFEEHPALTTVLLWANNHCWGFQPGS
jgi:hypothetical protein